MFEKLILTILLLAGISLAAMEQTKTFSLEKELSGDEALVKLFLADAHSPDITHEVAIPLDCAQLLGAIVDLLENLELRQAGFTLANVVLSEWLLIEGQLKRLHSIMHEASDAANLQEGIIADYEKLEAAVLVKLIHALDYLDIQPLLVIACSVLTQSKFGSVTFEQINTLPGCMGNRVMLHNLINCLGPLNGNELVVCSGHEGLIYGVCVTNDDKIVSASADSTVRIWSMDGKELAVYRGHQHIVTAVCATNTGKIISGSADNTVRIWDMNLIDHAVCRGHEAVVTAVCVTHEGHIVSGSRDMTVRIWDMNGKEIAILRGHQDAVYSVSVTNENKIISASWDRVVRVFDTKGIELAIRNGSVWDMKDKELTVHRLNDDTVISVCRTNVGTIRVLDKQGRELAVCRGNNRPICSLCVTKDGKIVSGSHDKKVRVWDVGLLDCIITMNQVHAKSLWEILQECSQQEVLDKQQLWKDIEKHLADNE